MSQKMHLALVLWPLAQTCFLVPSFALLFIPFHFHFHFHFLILVLSLSLSFVLFKIVSIKFVATFLFGI